MLQKKQKDVIPASFIPQVGYELHNNVVIPALVKNKPVEKVIQKIAIENDSDLENLKIKIFKSRANYTICLEREKLLQQRISEILDDINYYNDQLKQLDPNYIELVLPEQNTDKYVKTWVEDLNFEF